MAGIEWCHAERTFPGEDVRRPVREVELVYAPHPTGSALEPHPARRQRRDADHLRAEHRRVAVPADPRPGRVPEQIALLAAVTSSGR